MSHTSAVRSLITVFCLSILLTLIAFPVMAQTGAARPDRATKHNGSYSVSDIENINLQNGNVNLTIPLASLPPIAGGQLKWTLNAHYNSKIWDVQRTQQIGQAFDMSQHYYVVDNVQERDRGGWRVTGQYSFEIRAARQDFDYQLEKAIEIDPNYAIAHRELGLKLRHADRFLEAESHLEQSN